MSPTSALTQCVETRFEEAFGKPDTTIGGDSHWSLRPIPDGMLINVLVNGTMKVPVVWVFDPHDLKDGVMGLAIKDEDHVNEIVKQIQDRVTRAAQASGKT